MCLLPQGRPVVGALPNANVQGFNPLLGMLARQRQQVQDADRSQAAAIKPSALYGKPITPQLQAASGLSIEQGQRAEDRAKP